MATSKVEIWNMALAYIGHERFVVGPDEKSSEANFCRKFYDPLLRSQLTMFDWTFANKRKQLPLIYDARDDVNQNNTNQLNNNKIPDYRFMYGYPSDCLKPIYLIPVRLFSENANNTVYSYEGGVEKEMFERMRRQRVPFEIKVVDQAPFTNTNQDKKVVITDSENAMLDYTAEITDVSLFTPMFEQMLALNLARPLVAALAKDGKRLSAINDMYNLISIDAEVIDANSETDDQLPADSEFLRVR